MSKIKVLKTLAGTIVPKVTGSRSARVLSKKQQAAKGMGTSDSYRVSAAKRGKRTTGQASQLDKDKKKLEQLEDIRDNLGPNPELNERIAILKNKIKDTQKRTGLRKSGGSVGTKKKVSGHNRLY